MPCAFAGLLTRACGLSWQMTLTLRLNPQPSETLSQGPVSLQAHAAGASADRLQHLAVSDVLASALVRLSTQACGSSSIC